VRVFFVLNPNKTKQNAIKRKIETQRNAIFLYLRMQDKFYTIKQASEILGINVRAVQTRCKRRGVTKRSGKYIISSHLLDQWKQDILITQSETQRETQIDAMKTQRALEDAVGKPKVPFQTTNKDEPTDDETYQEKLRKAIELITIEASKQNVTHKIFTEVEYEDIIGTLDRVEHQQEQIQYLRNRIEKQDIALNNLFKSIEQRNFIEAKQKGYDKEGE